MEPYTKKRRLAPKVAEKHIHEQLPETRRYDYHYPPPIHDPPPSQPDQSDFDAFARHLQDAALKIYSQANRSPYNSVSVLLIRWEEDASVEPELLALQNVLVERFNYRADCWNIPSGPNPGVKLSMQLAQHIEYARPDHLLIIYYAGFGFVGGDHHSYWACNSREDSSKLKWEGIRCMIEDAQCDILLLLDSCAVADGPAASNTGIKQGIAAYGRDAVPDMGPRSFTYNMVEALQKLSSGPAFTIPRLYEELVSQKHQQLQEHGSTNGIKKSLNSTDRLPVAFTLTPGTLQSIVLAPVSSRGQVASPINSPDGEVTTRGTNGEHTYTDNGSIESSFDDPRALVKISVQGDPSRGMTSFKQWLVGTSVAARRVSVEGLFHGPPTLIFASMPISIFQAISQTLPSDRITFLGYVKSHNVLGEYKVDSQSPGPKPSARELEDGRILLEAAGAAAYSPSMIRHDPSPQSMHASSNMMYPVAPPPPLPDRNIGSSDRKDEDTEEMHEAAIQLKALSHIRHMSQGDVSERPVRHQTSHISVPEESPGPRSLRDDSVSSQEGNDSAEDNIYNSEYNSPASSRSKPRRPIQKQGPKQDNRCSLCSHVPFKDSSSLRKHIAAAHTRPFPCAFAFAGCTSTFGSKNEWKRHIASQHLCLTYYRCSSCPQSSVEGKGNEFNRKDLFTQHLRRMHAPFAIKKAIAKGDSKLQVEWETHVKDMQASCLVTRRLPPTRSACPKPDCSNVFEGAGSWDDWTEHVGRHMEKGEAARLGVDRLLAKWALEEGIIERKEDGEYRLCGSERESGNANSGYYSDGGKREEEIKPEDNMLLDDIPR